MILKIWTNDEISMGIGTHHQRLGTKINIHVSDEWAKKIIDQICENFGEDAVMKMVKDEI